VTERGGPRVGIALSGGIAKVLAHVGILKALDEAGIRVDAVAATSGGSIIGAFYAAGWTADEMAKAAETLSWKRLTRVTIPRMGLLSNEKMETFVRDHLGDISFSDLRVPLAVVAANLSNGQKAVFREGKIAVPIRGSCSVPQLFSPVVIDGDLIVDGGLVEYLPVETLVEEFHCDVNLGVNLGGVRNWHVKDPRNLFEVALRIVGFVSQRNAIASEAMADLVLRPDLSGFGPYDLDRSDEMIQVGYDCAKRALPEIRDLIERRAASAGEANEWKRIARWFREFSPMQALGRKAK
jgi:NTE family protein